MLKNIILLLAILVSVGLFSQPVSTGIRFQSNEKIEKEAIVGFLPFFKNSFDKGGTVSPLPFGVGVVGMIFQQAYTSSNLIIKGKTSEEMGSLDIYARADSVQQNTVAGESSILISPGLWVLPFMNVYGIIGYSSGQINPDLQIHGITVENPFNPGEDLLSLDTAFVLNDKIKYQGATYGFGTSLSMSYKKMFFMVDYQYTITKPSDLDGNLYKHFLSPKVGLFIDTKNQNTKLVAWVGALYLSNNHSFKGEITVSEIAPELVSFFGEKAEYSGDIVAKSNWNVLLGSKLSIGNGHNVFIEAGFVNRLQLSLGYSFVF